jgi:hypothetical protein
MLIARMKINRYRKNTKKTGTTKTQRCTNPTHSATYQQVRAYLDKTCGAIAWQSGETGAR